VGCCGAKTAPKGSGATVRCPEGERYATPDAEVLARARGIDLCTVKATGRGGQIINRQDVLRAMNARV
jgi:pyruvate/2-oxoglutarate dehydrogenase complex dihydrolipoamide acyltransferase (E2) component